MELLFRQAISGKEATPFLQVLCRKALVTAREKCTTILQFYPVRSDPVSVGSSSLGGGECGVGKASNFRPQLSREEQNLKHIYQ